MKLNNDLSINAFINSNIHLYLPMRNVFGFAAQIVCCTKCWWYQKGLFYGNIILLLHSITKYSQWWAFRLLKMVRQPTADIFPLSLFSVSWQSIFFLFFILFKSSCSSSPCMNLQDGSFLCFCENNTIIFFQNFQQCCLNKL